MPPGVPAKDFWSLVLYENQTRSMLQTEQQFPSLNSQRGVKQNRDGSTDIFFGPAAPVGKESNWIQTVPGKGYSVILRLYGPLDAWFDKTWQSGEVERMEDVPVVEPTGNNYEYLTPNTESVYPMAVKGLMTVMGVLPDDLFQLVMESVKPVEKGTVFAEVVRRFGAPERYKVAPKMMEMD